MSALVLDYDGRIAVDGVLDPAVREAIAYRRQRGVARRRTRLKWRPHDSY